MSGFDVKEYNKVYYQNNKSRIKKKVREHQLKHRYGIDENTYQQMLTDQNNRCKICDCDLDSKLRKHIDHCHKTGKVRSILCINCNSGIGIFWDDPVMLRRAADYLEAHNV